MKLFRKAAIALILLLFASAAISYACTSIIVSGKVTPDGRPLIWKNRDTGAARNIMRHFPAQDGKYAFTGIVAEKSKDPNSVWVGSNSEGFAIFNTVSYNVEPDTLNGKSGGNGIVMRMALERCATVADFEKMLQEMPKPWKVETNYGVMDAQGNAAYFEVGNYEYYKYDVNDPAVAPDGYLVRSNFSYNGRPRIEGKGHCRYMTAEAFTRKGLAAGITPEFVLNNHVRCYANVLMDLNLRGDENHAPKTTGWAYDNDFITRKTTTCSVVITGVKPGENPELTTMWTVVSYPGTTVALPVWEAVGEEGLPVMVRGNEKYQAPLSKWGYTLKERAYTFDLDNDENNHKRYFNWELFYNGEGTGYLQKVLRLEAEVLPPYREALNRWYAAGKIDRAELKKLNAAADEKIAAFYKANFDL